MPSEPAPFVDCSVHSSACERALLSWQPQELRAAPWAEQLPMSSPAVTSRVTQPCSPVTTCTLKTVSSLSHCTARVCSNGSLWPVLLCQAAAGKAQGSTVSQLTAPSPLPVLKEQQMPGHGAVSALQVTRDAWWWAETSGFSW